MLLHNDFQNATNNWSYLAPALAAAGYCVFDLTYGVPAPYAALAGTPVAPGALTRNEDSALEVASFVTEVLKATGSRKIDLVGDGMGTLVGQYWLRFLGGSTKTRTFVGIAPVWHGTSVWQPLASSGANEAISPAYEEVRTGSAFLRHLGSGPVPGIRYTDIMAKNDEVILPYTSGVMAHAVRNYVLQETCPTDAAEHWTLAFDPVVAQMTMNALDPSHASPINCGRALASTQVAPDPLPPILAAVQQAIPY